MPTPRLIHLLPAVLLSILLVGCADEAEEVPAETTSGSAELVQAAVPSGQVLYERHCQSCHGPEGRGEGSMTDELTKSLPDLTTLAAQHDGSFPEEYVRTMIDGREMLSAHGTRQMPIWGNIWASSDGVPSEEAAAAERLDNLVEYLKTLQESN